MCADIFLLGIEDDPIGGGGALDLDGESRAGIRRKRPRRATGTRSRLKPARTNRIENRRSPLCVALVGLGGFLVLRVDLWWAGRELNSRPSPCQSMTGTSLTS